MSQCAEALVETMVKQLSTGERILDVVTSIYASVLYDEAYPNAPATITTTAIKTIAAFVPPVAAATEVASAFRDDDSRNRAVARYLALIAGLGMLRRAAKLASQTFHYRLIMEAALTEFERARSLSQTERPCDVFALALIEAFVAKELSCDGMATELWRPVALHLLQSVEEITVDVNRLEAEEDEAQRALDSVRSTFSDEEVNQSYSRLELGLISRDEPLAFSREPAHFLSYGQAQLGTVVSALAKARTRLEMYRSTLLKLTNMYGAA